MIASKIPDQRGAKFQPYTADECPNQDCFILIARRFDCEPDRRVHLGPQTMRAGYLRALMDDAPEV